VGKYVIDVKQTSELERPAIHLSAPMLTEDDVFLVSYPRSGNTWLRMIIAYILYGESDILCLSDLDRLVPSIYRGVGREGPISIPRVIKTHQPYGQRHERHRRGLYSRIIYVVRHPVDVYRSYHDFTFRGCDRTIEDARRFVHRQLNGAGDFGSWENHLLSWKTMEDDIDILFLRYESLQDNAADYIARIGSFLGHPITGTRAGGLKRLTDIDAMRNLEEKGGLKKKYSMVRRSQQRKCSVEFDDSIERMIKERCSTGMELFKYE
jgi:estrone sulfotransferase